MNTTKQALFNVLGLNDQIIGMQHIGESSIHKNGIICLRIILQNDASIHF